MWLYWQWHEWPRWQGHLSEDLDTEERRGRGRCKRRRKDGDNEKGVGKMSAGSPGSTSISLSLFSVVWKDFSVPWVVLHREIEWGVGRGGGLNHRGQEANKQENFNRSWIFICTFCTGDVIAVPRRPIKLNGRELFSHQLNCTGDLEPEAWWWRISFLKNLLIY